MFLARGGRRYTRYLSNGNRAGSFAQSLICIARTGADNKRIKYAVGRAKAHNFEQQEIGEARAVILGQFTFGILQCLLSVRVGDTKGSAPKSVAEFL